MSRPTIAAEPIALRTRSWRDHALLDSGLGGKLERFGRLTVVRPEPQCVWPRRLPDVAWSGADAIFVPSAVDDEDAGGWRFAERPPEGFDLQWGPTRFTARFTSFRHLAFFPEQAANWAWLEARIAAALAKTAPQAPAPSVLNLFGYTGIASLVCAAAGARVTHVDASKKSVAWARENAMLSGLPQSAVRWIVEDATKWVRRETKRGAQYEGVILDPPKFGRGPGGEVWRLFEDLPELIGGCAGLLGASASFLLINAYAARVSGLALAHATAEALGDRGGRVEWGELALEEEGVDPRAVGLSFFARWSAPS